MTLQETCEKITKKLEEAGKDEGRISTRLREHKLAKEYAEAEKAAALANKDENAYKQACRVIADADAGIEFNTICLRDVKRKIYATEAENREIEISLSKNAREIYLDAINKIETEFNSILETAQIALRKMQALDSMDKSWKMAVMRDYMPGIYIYGDKALHLEQYSSKARATLETINKQKEAVI